MVIQLGGWAETTSPKLGLVTHSTVGLIPVGAVEQHGPHLPLGTDTIIATELCSRVAERTDALTLPPLVIGCSLGHGTRLPGTLSVTPFQLAELAIGMVRWAAETSKIRKFLLVNAHVGNASALGIATDQLRSERPDLQAGYVNWGDLTAPLVAAVSADASDWHANRAETSLMMVLAPDLVDEDARCSADDPDRTAGDWSSATPRRRCPSTGSPDTLPKRPWSWVNGCWRRQLAACPRWWPTPDGRSPAMTGGPWTQPFFASVRRPMVVSPHAGEAFSERRLRPKRSLSPGRPVETARARIPRVGCSSGTRRVRLDCESGRSLRS